MNYFHFNLKKLVAERVRYIASETLWPPGHPGLEVTAQLTPDVGLAAFQAVVENTLVSILSEEDYACDGEPLRTIPSGGGLLQGRPESTPRLFHWSREPANRCVMVLVSYHGPTVEVPEAAELRVIITPVVASFEDDSE